MKGTKIYVQAQFGGAIIKEFTTTTFSKEDKQKTLDWIEEQGLKVVDTYTGTLVQNFTYVVVGR